MHGNQRGVLAVLTRVSGAVRKVVGLPSWKDKIALAMKQMIDWEKSGSSPYSACMLSMSSKEKAVHAHVLEGRMSVSTHILHCRPHKQLHKVPAHPRANFVNLHCHFWGAPRVGLDNYAVLCGMRAPAELRIGPVDENGGLFVTTIRVPGGETADLAAVNATLTLTGVLPEKMLLPFLPPPALTPTNPPVLPGKKRGDGAAVPASPAASAVSPLLTACACSRACHLGFPCMWSPCRPA
jgi:hypothetical protein